MEDSGKKNLKGSADDFGEEITSQSRIQLTGKYFNTLDEKGRISFPSKIRAAVGGFSLVATQALENCLWLFPPDEWERLKSTVMQKASPFNKQHRIVLRNLIAPACEIEFDKSGRLSIPQVLREYAGLSRECVILGIDKYIELWDAASYKKYTEETADSFAEAAEELNAISF